MRVEAEMEAILLLCCNKRTYCKFLALCYYMGKKIPNVLIGSSFITKGSSAMFCMVVLKIVCYILYFYEQHVLSPQIIIDKNDVSSMMFATKIM